MYGKKYGYVYLLGDFLKEGYYKIGVTRGNIENRIKKLQTGNAGEIYLVSSYKTQIPFHIENKLHLKYHNEKILNEWFELPLEEVSKFKDNCKHEEELIEGLMDNEFVVKNLK